MYQPVLSKKSLEANPIAPNRFPDSPLNRSSNESVCDFLHQQTV